LLLAYVATGIFYSVTEVGFRVLTPSWIFLLIAVVGASSVAGGLIAGEEPTILASRIKRLSKISASDECIPQPQGATALFANGDELLGTELLRSRMENA
jgi:hypothetical protein